MRRGAGEKGRGVGWMGGLGQEEEQWLVLQAPSADIRQDGQEPSAGGAAQPRQRACQAEGTDWQWGRAGQARRITLPRADPPTPSPVQEPNGAEAGPHLLRGCRCFPSMSTTCVPSTACAPPAPTAGSLLAAAAPPLPAAPSPPAASTFPAETALVLASAAPPSVTSSASPAPVPAMAQAGIRRCACMLCWHAAPGPTPRPPTQPRRTLVGGCGPRFQVIFCQVLRLVLHVDDVRIR